MRSFNWTRILNRKELYAYNNSNQRIIQIRISKLEIIQSQNIFHPNSSPGYLLLSALRKYVLEQWHQTKKELCISSTTSGRRSAQRWIVLLPRSMTKSVESRLQSWEKVQAKVDVVVTSDQRLRVLGHVLQLRGKGLKDGCCYYLWLTTNGFKSCLKLWIEDPCKKGHGCCLSSMITNSAHCKLMTDGFCISITIVICSFLMYEPWKSQLPQLSLSQPHNSTMYN